MAVEMSVANGGFVIGTPQLGSANSGVSRINAVAGARYVLADSLGGAAAVGVSVKRIGKSLIISKDSDDAEQDMLIIEDFYGSNSQLVSQSADGQYQNYSALTQNGAVDAADLSDGESSTLALISAQPAAVASSFEFEEGASSVFSSALAGVAAVAGGFALSNNGSSGGSKPHSAPVASAFAVEDQLAQPERRIEEVDLAAGAPAISDSTDGAAFNDVVSNAGNNAAVELTPAVEAEASSPHVSVDVAVAIEPFAFGDIPVIEKVMDNKGTIQGLIENGGYTDDATPTLMGKAEPGVKVHVYRGKYLQGFVVTDANGEWEYTPPSGFNSDTHAFTVKYEYADKVTSGYSAPYVITIDKIPPGVPQISGMMDNEGRITGAITDQTITDDNRPVITGTAEAHAKLIVYDRGNEIGSVTVGADGAWSFTPDTPLADGLHMLSYSAVDRVGNRGDRTDVTEFIVDTRLDKISIFYAEDNVGSVTDDVFNGGVTDDTTPTLFGSATAGGIVKIYEGSTLLGEAIADVDGTWQFTPSVALGEGPHTFHATVTLVAKGESAPSKLFKLEVDITAPAAPTIDQVWDNAGGQHGALANGQSTDDTTPTLSGKAEAGSTVHIYDKGSLLGDAVSDVHGNWSFTPNPPLLSGDHEFTVKAEDKAGNISASSNGFVIEIDTTPPAKPVIETVYDDQGNQTGNLLSGDATDDTMPTLRGSAEPNSTIVIKDDGVEIGRASVGVDGKWTFEPTAPLVLGLHKLTAEAVDAAGNTSVPSDRFDLTVGNPDQPAAPSITSVIDDVGSTTGNIQKNGVTDDQRPTVNGSAQPGMTVSVYIDGELAGTTVAKASGEWSFTPTVDLIDGLHIITATATNSLGNISPEAGDYPITVDTVPPLAPNPDDAKLWDDAGTITGPIKSGDVTDDNTPTFIGKTEPNATVVIYDNGEEIGRVQAGPAGDWEFTPTEPLIDGDHKLNYEVIDVAGNVGPKSNEIVFEIDTSKLEVSIDSATDDAGKITGVIALNGVTDDTTPTLHGKGTAGGLVKVYEGSALLGEVVVGVDGKWSLTPAIALGEGPHSLTATVTTPAHGESERSNTFEFTVDLTPPGGPTIEEVSDNVGASQGALSHGQHTDDATPTLAGKADAGTTVHIYDKGELLGSVVADVDGEWSFTPVTPLIDGDHDFTVIAQDKAGNTSAPSPVFGIVVDTIPPAAPVIETVFDDQGAKTGNLASGETTDDAIPTISGSAEANSVVIIKDRGNEIGRVAADATGKWSFEPTVALAAGSHEFTAESVDAAGNVSQPSNGFTIGVDLVPPTTPTITELEDNFGYRIGMLMDDSVTDDTKLGVLGTGKAGETIEIRIDGVAVGRTVVDINGSWNYTLEADLTDGHYVFTAVAISAGGAESASSNTFSTEIDTVAPDRPIVESVEDNVGGWKGFLQNGQATDDLTPTFRGKAEPGSEIVVFDNGAPTGEYGDVDEEGNWVFFPSSLEFGEHSFTFYSLDPAGNWSKASAPWVMTVAFNARSLDKGGETDAVLSVQDVLADVSVELFADSGAASAKVLNPPSAQIVGLEETAHESWAATDISSQAGSGWSDASTLGGVYLLDQQLNA